MYDDKDNNINEINLSRKNNIFFGSRHTSQAIKNCTHCEYSRRSNVLQFSICICGYDKFFNEFFSYSLLLVLFTFYFSTTLKSFFFIETKQHNHRNRQKESEKQFRLLKGKTSPISKTYTNRFYLKCTNFFFLSFSCYCCLDRWLLLFHSYILICVCVLGNNNNNIMMRTPHAFVSSAICTIAPTENQHTSTAKKNNKIKSMWTVQKIQHPRVETDFSVAHTP